MKVSVVIPHMEDLEGVEAALDLCIKSLKGDYDELLVIRNKGIGYGPAVNEGLCAATGDYLIVMNNDLKVLHGSLIDFIEHYDNIERDKPDWKFILTPKITPEPRDIYPRCIFGMTREIYNLIKEGDQFYDERFTMGYWEDDDLIWRLKIAQVSTIQIPSPLVYHLNGGGLTMKQVGEQEYFDLNKKRFESKWTI